ncbi:MAG: hypothetical protein KDC95_11590, partial [Planctomycetes bacterium]|nr:hypothetical protein [Planctomycetota bacterium]
LGRLALFWGAALFASLGCGPSDSEGPPPGFATVDHDIRLGVRVGQLRYDLEEFTVRPGARVKLTLTNNDSMQHNLVICRSGAGAIDRVAQAALALGEKASAQDFVPRHQDVLEHTKALMPGEAQSLWFRAPKVMASYPFVCTLPGHSFTMRGVMVVGEVRDPLLSDLRYDVFDGAFRALSDLEAARPTKTGTLDGGLFDIDALEKKTNYGVWFHASLRLAKAGSYRFYLRSDDGARIRVDGKEVVVHDGIHPAGPEREGGIQLRAGRHDLRVEYFQGGGGQALHIAIAGPDLRKTDLTPTTAKKVERRIPIMVMHDPVVMRVHVEQASSRSIAVGLPSGMNCVFDAETCRMQFGWSGAFLDVTPDRLGRGGQPCRILGQRFEVGDLGFPLRRSGTSATAVRFLGYETGKRTRFLLDWDGQEVVWSVTSPPSGIGLRYDFELPGNTGDVQFVMRREGLDVEASAGTWSGDSLTIPAKDASRFTVTLRLQGEPK